MIRIRLHGRGGQGVKVASRVMGTAAFKAGFYAQDSPVYGAERRGAPVAAFTRFGSEPIQERGAIERPDLVVVFDETLFDNPLSDPTAGVKKEGVIAINTGKSTEQMKEMLGLPQRIVCLNVTAVSMALLGRNLLSGSFTGAVAKIVGFGRELLEEALHEELTAIGLDSSQIAKNIEAAGCCYDMTPDTPLSESIDDAPTEEEEAYQPRFFLADVASPTVLKPGNALQRKTGGWRQLRPVVFLDQCRPCFTCYLRCPEGAISLDGKNYPVIDYDYCKGCMVCYEVCPREAIHQEVEANG